ncbi:MAG: 1-acyl-sn-glycerol-3-phosphate acyltransferase [Oscillospiraceae bacterium]|nr:1-acyl-sn-glycerol-3-phosphate acyltransferase [Oscillospiraceae bacterium]
MDSYTRHQKIWRILYALTNRWICRKFNMRHEDLDLEGPVLLIPNHVSAWDPLLVAMSLRKKQVYYVASEHIFRLGPVTRLLNWLVAPIPRRKASSGADTVKACLRHLREGHSVCLFAEGEQSWDGLTQPIFPATGKLARSSGATLVTYRLEGGYLSLPRWAKGVRRGSVYGHPVHVYPPEQLRRMSPAEIDESIQRDIAENAWARQRVRPVSYKGKRRAEGLEKALYLCPRCHQIGTLKTRGDRLFCSCGLSLRYEETGFFEPAEPFATIADWDAWQRSALKSMDKPAGDLLFSDTDMTLSRISAGHKEETLGSSELRQYADRLCCGDYTFMLAEISSMAMVQANLLLLSYREKYYQIRSEKGANLRKYLELWKEK